MSRPVAPRGFRPSVLIALLLSLPLLAFGASQAQAAGLSAGGDHACALKTDGTVWCWGTNDFGELGSDVPVGTDRAVPTKMVGFSDATSVASGAASNCALRRGGTVVCWGQNLAGQLGNGNIAYGEQFAQTVLNLTDVKQVAVGGFHACAITGDGAAWCWGSNESGELGDGTKTSSPVPVRVQGLSKVTQIDPADSHTCAVDADRGVVCWGDNTNDQLGSDVGATSPTPVTVPGLSGAKAVTTGSSHTCAITAQRTVSCWGSDASGQLGDGLRTNRTTPATVAGLTNVYAISGGGLHTCAVLADGTSRCWGSSISGELGQGTAPTSGLPVAVNGLTGAVDIVTGDFFSCALLGTGTVSCWGDGYFGQLGDAIDGAASTARSPVPVAALGTGVVDLDVEQQNGCAIKSDHSVVCWGWGGYGVLGHGQPSATAATPVPVDGLPSNVVSIGVGYAYACALTDAGTVWCWGNSVDGQAGHGAKVEFSEPVQVNNLTDATKLSVGIFSSCVVRAGGTVSCWGRGTSGQLGNGGNIGSAVPVAVSTPAGFTGITDVSVGALHACAVATGGQVWCWGSDDSDQLGPDVADSNVPIEVDGVTGASAVSAGAVSSCALLTTTVKCWGEDIAGELGDGAVDSSDTVTTVGSGYTSVAVGGYYACGVLSSGQARCWGDNSAGNIGDGTITTRPAPVTVGAPLTGVSALRASIATTCALRTAGAVSCWGDGYYGQLADGSAPTGHGGLNGAVHAVVSLSGVVAPPIAIDPVPTVASKPTPTPASVPTPTPTLRPAVVPTPVAPARLIHGKFVLTGWALKLASSTAKACPSKVTILATSGKSRQKATAKVTSLTVANKLTCTVSVKLKLKGKLKRAKTVTVKVSGKGVKTTTTRVKSG